MADHRAFQQPGRSQREQLERGAAVRGENVFGVPTPESSNSSTVQLEDLQASSGVRLESPDEFSRDSTPEGHIETLPQHQRVGSKPTSSLSRRAQQIMGFGGSGGALPVPRARSARQTGFQTPGEAFSADPTPQHTATTAGHSAHSQVVVVSSDTEESPDVSAQLVGSSVGDSHRSDSPQSQSGPAWLLGMLGATGHPDSRRFPLRGNSPGQREARHIIGAFAVVDSERPGAMVVLEHRPTAEAPWSGILRISGLSVVHAEVFDDLLSVQKAGDFFQFRAQSAFTSADVSLPILDFTGGTLLEPAVQLLQSEVAVKLVRDAINLYRSGWEDARAESRTVLDMQVLTGDMDETSPEDVEAATALVLWAVLTRAFSITPRLEALQCWVFTALFDMFQVILLTAVESGVPAALESLRIPHSYSPALAETPAPTGTPAPVGTPAADRTQAESSEDLMEQLMEVAKTGVHLMRAWWGEALNTWQREQRDKPFRHLGKALDQDTRHRLQPVVDHLRSLSQESLALVQVPTDGCCAARVMSLGAVGSEEM